MSKVGRPVEWTDEIADEICERLSQGESLLSISKDEHIPSQPTIYKRIQQDEIFAKKYARARESQAEYFLEEIITISDNATDDVIFLTSEDASGESGKPAIKHSAIQRARLQVDTRKWAMSKLAPKKYGDKSVVAGDPDQPIKVDTTITILPVKPA